MHVIESAAKVAGGRPRHDQPGVLATIRGEMSIRSLGLLSRKTRSLLEKEGFQRWISVRLGRPHVLHCAAPLFCM